MAWRRRGHVFAPDGSIPWMGSHAALPVAERDASGRCRVSFSARDALERARIGSFDLDLASLRITNLRPEPLLDLGPLGAFDDAGVTSSWLVTRGERTYLYYSGWSLGVSVPFYFYVGLAVSDDGGRTFARPSRAPLLERSDVDPFLTASPCVLIEGDTWRMWYVSGTGWRLVDGRPRHSYHVKYAESRDGVRWRRWGHVCIDYASADEYAIARPCVVRDGARYRMWFCARGARYRLGYAESADGLDWRRDDAAAGLDPAPEGWDSEMIAYPYVFEHDGRWHMLYNGNGYGATGVGLAAWHD